jgi:hypothetical protein
MENKKQDVIYLKAIYNSNRGEGNGNAFGG